MAHPVIDLELLHDKAAAVRYGYARELMNEVKADPRAYLHCLDDILSLLSDHLAILRWNATDMLGYVAAAGDSEAAETAIGQLLPMMKRGDLIETAHVIFALSLIARRHRFFREICLRAMAGLESVRFKTDECREIVIGHALKNMHEYLADEPFPADVMSFISNAVRSSRHATAKKAVKLLKKLNAL